MLTVWDDELYGKERTCEECKDVLKELSDSELVENIEVKVIGGSAR
jgi:uncharacterized protein with PIN domain